MVLVLESREIVYRLIKPVADQGKFSLDDVDGDSRGNLRSLDDIAHTTDPSALLGVLSAALKDDNGPPALSIPGISYPFVDKVRHFRNGFAHFEAVFEDTDYVQDNVKSVNDLKLGLLNAQTRLPARQSKPSPNPRVEPLKAQPRPPVRQPVRQHEPSETVLRRDSYGFPWSRRAYTQAAKGNEGTTPLHRPALAGHSEKRLHYAVRNGHAEEVNALIVAGADVNAKGYNGNTPLHYAVRNGLAEIPNALIVAGADVNTKADDGETPLHYAVRNSQAKMANALIVAGADVNVKGNNGDTPLHYAVRNSHARMANALIVAGADANVKGNNGDTPLHRAVERTYLEVAQVLIAGGARVNTKADDGETPLHYAVRNSQARMANALIVAGADVNVKGNNGDTPLHYAVRNSHARMAQALIAGGARVNTKADVNVLEPAVRRIEKRKRRNGFLIKWGVIALLLTVAAILLQNC